MKVVLVGPPDARARLRTQMNGSTTIVGEFASLGYAQAARLDADALVMATGNADDQDILEALTSREIQVLELLAEGRSNKAIGQRLGISDQTVKLSRRGDRWKTRRRESHRRGPSSDSPRHCVGVRIAIAELC